MVVIFRTFLPLSSVNMMRTIVCETENEPSTLPCQVFDLICGASTGGILAILLGRLGLDCLTAISICKELGP